MQARAAIFRHIDQPLSIEDIEVDKPGPNEVRVRTVACGVCHSDLHFVQGKLPLPVPAILGHEPAGIVEEVGSRVATVAPGDHVIACTSIRCGNCRQCLEGRPNLCTNRGACQRPPEGPPRLSQHGEALHQFADLAAFAEQMLLHENAVVKIDPEIPLNRAALVGCAVTTGVGAALNTARVAPGSSVAVFGAGGVGISVIQGARIAGARQIIAVDISNEKLDTARRFGATDGINSMEEDPVRAIKKLSRGGADYAFEAVGQSKLLEQCFYSLAPAGTAVLVGVIPAGEKVEFNPLHFFLEKRVIGCMMGSNRFQIDAPRYLELYRQNRLDLDGMVTRESGLADINEAFRAMEAGEVTRTVLTFD